MTVRGEEDRARSFREVLDAELGEIARSRERRGVTSPSPEAADPFARAHAMQLAGLAFSGGGIRSATFHLGVLQALAERRLLRRFDYLSTVSGGGYIGAWFAAWIKRSGLDAVLEGLGAAWRQGPDGAEARQVRFLREYSNYLTPRRGLFGSDTWTMVGIYVRNLLLNLAILVLAFAAFLIAPRLLVLAYTDAAVGAGPGFLVWGFLCLWLTITVVVLNIATISGPGASEGGPGRYANPWLIQACGVWPILIAAWLVSAWLWNAERARWGNWWQWGLGGAVAYLLIWVEGWCVGAYQLYADARAERAPAPPLPPHGPQRRLGARAERLHAATRQLRENLSRLVEDRFGQPIGRKMAGVLLSAVFAGFAGGALLLAVAVWIRSWTLEASQPVPAIWGAPLVVVVFLLAATLHIGLAGPQFTEEEREWWGRLGASVLRWTILVAGLTVVAYYGPWGLDRLAARAGAWVKGALASGWLVTTGLGLLAGKSPATGKGDGNRALELAGRVAPHVFAVGLMVLLAALTQGALPDPMERSPWLWACVFGLGALATLLSWRVGINEFSMHSLYRNRLVRCYLGASNDRHPHPFTGFDRADDGIAVGDLTVAVPAGGGGRPYVGPYPIVNAALNLVKGERLAWQQRKATSFVFSPQYTGYDAAIGSHGGAGGRLAADGYRPTRGRGPSLTLGTAMAISGAAASPNMGYHSSPPLAFLMTVFNVRLGWWFGNPRHPRCWNRPGPRWGLFYLLFELLGSTNDRRGFVYLSDGGHFENLGVYELVKRRCRFILACDASQDGKLQFGDLGNAVEKCRTDLGIDIRIDAEALRGPAGGGRQRQHWALGRICYGTADPGAPDGTFLYLKASLTCDEPQDVKSYQRQHPGFPHQSTADQWFEEDQFESYRALGHHIADRLLERLPVPERVLEAGLDELRAALGPPEEGDLWH